MSLQSSFVRPLSKAVGNGAALMARHLELQDDAHRGIGIVRGSRRIVRERRDVRQMTNEGHKLPDLLVRMIPRRHAGVSDFGFPAAS